MKTITSVSGGKTSAFIASNYKSDDLVFALVRTDDKDCQFKDKKLVQMVEDRINKPFIGTLEDDIIIHTIFDLEQYLGQKINWVSGITFDEVVNTKGGWLPSKMRRFCTTHMKIEPIFDWWKSNFSQPVIMNIGYRANEINRAKSMLKSLNENGFNEHKTIIGKHKNGNNKWQTFEWRKPAFPLIEDGWFKDEIESFWQNKPVRFAEFNNCVGCFHGRFSKLKYVSQKHESKFNWFIKQEKKGKGNWRDDLSYSDIKNANFQPSFFGFGSSTCESGFCGI